LEEQEGPPRQREATFTLTVGKNSGSRQRTDRAFHVRRVAPPKHAKLPRTGGNERRFRKKRNFFPPQASRPDRQKKKKGLSWGRGKAYEKEEKPLQNQSTNGRPWRNIPRALRGEKVLNVSGKQKIGRKRKKGRKREDGVGRLNRSRSLGFDMGGTKPVGRTKEEVPQCRRKHGGTVRSKEKAISQKKRKRYIDRVWKKENRKVQEESLPDRGKKRGGMQLFWARRQRGKCESLLRTAHENRASEEGKKGKTTQRAGKTYV